MYGGTHFVINALSAICVGIKNEIPIHQIIDGIASFELTKSRMEIVERKDGAKIINDCYNASYDSMKAALEYLGRIKANKKIAILGDMGELGEYAKELHEKVGEEIYNNQINILITVGDNARYFANKAISLGMNQNNIYTFENKEKARRGGARL